MIDPIPSDTNRLLRPADDTLFGRDEELAWLQQTLTADRPLVSFVHGLPGLGKSALLRHFSRQASAAGATPCLLDCRQIEPTVPGFLAAWSEAAEVPLPKLEQARQLVESRPGLTVLGLDHYESLQLLDTWLRQEFMPKMPDTLRLVIASRHSPVPLWATAPGWQDLWQSLALTPLDEAASRQLLRPGQFSAKLTNRIIRQAHGNPLALKMAVATLSGKTALTLPPGGLNTIVQRLAELFLAEVPDAATRTALESASVARRVTLSLLRALPDVDPAQFEQLRRLPFIESTRDGLRIQTVVRDAIATMFRANDPARFYAARRHTWAQLRDELGQAPRSELWRSTADMLFLIENPVIRNAFFPDGDQTLAVEPATPPDWLQIREMIRRHDGEAGVAPLAAWWRHRPDAFRVVRDQSEHIVAFYCMAEAAEPVMDIALQDPLAAVWQDHLSSNPLPTGTRALFLRRWLSTAGGEAPSPGQAACWLDAKRTYMELRPALRRVYLTVADLTAYAQAATQLGFEHLPTAAIDLGTQTFESALLDFGPESVDGWLTRLVGDEMGIVVDSPIDRERRAVVRDGREYSLTPLEYHLALYLEARAGTTATRDEILAAVWGAEDGSGSSNVVDAVVKSLRKKLGKNLQLIETVRGFGYRWRK